MSMTTILITSFKLVEYAILVHFEVIYFFQWLSFSSEVTSNYLFIYLFILYDKI